MAKLLKATGEILNIEPRGDFWDLKELQTLVGGYIEVVVIRVPRLSFSHVLVVDEEFQYKDLAQNLAASTLAGQYIAGDAVLVERRHLD